MKKSLLEILYEALGTFRLLMENTSTTEAECQEWFEKNPIIFNLLGYTNFLPHPSQITCTNGEEYIPDFIVQRFNGIWEIFELKIPFTKVLKKNDRRKSFYSSFESYISQCREYSQFYQIPENRKKIEDKYGIKIQSEFFSTIVAGNENFFDKKKAYDMLFDRANKVNIVTYNDIENLLSSSICLQTAHLENLPGLTYSTILWLPSSCSKKFQYICDFGIFEDRSRISIGITSSEELFINIYAEDKRIMTKSIKLENAGIRYEKTFNLHIEFGLSENNTYLTMFIDGRFIYHQIYNKIDLHPSVFYYWILGSDLYAKTEADHRYSQIIMFDRTLSVEDRIELSKYFLETYQPYYELETSYPGSIRFSGLSYIHHYKHPNFTQNKAIPTELPKSKDVMCWYIVEKERAFFIHPFLDKHYNAIRAANPEMIGKVKETINFKRDEE